MEGWQNWGDYAAASLRVDLQDLIALAVAIAIAELLSQTFTVLARDRWYSRIKDDFPEDAREDEEDDRIDWRSDWLPKLMGRTEVAAYVILLGLRVDGAAAFVAAWIALKMATGWNLLGQKKRYYRRMGMAALILNLLNLAFGLIGAAAFHRLSHV